MAAVSLSFSTVRMKPISWRRITTAPAAAETSAMLLDLVPNFGGNNMVEKGDRIELVYMGHDPLPIQRGTKGTVYRVLKVPSCMDCTQVSVDWDNGRKLSLVVPPDKFRTIA